jgi:hypothetical protein
MMSLGFLAALWGSKPFRWAMGALVALGVYQGWKYKQRSIGAERITAKIEQKADTDAKQVEQVREAVANPGKRPGPDDPSRLRSR